jgi:ribonuclease HI
MPNKPQVTIYTDGGASPNPGPGGWGVVLIHSASGRVKELHGGEPSTTNNRMELTAAIRALEALKGPCVVTMITDSEYLRRGIAEWLPVWIASGWKRGKGADVQNEDLWRRLAMLTGHHEVAWEWVKGHAGNAYNERADALASRAIRQYRSENASTGAAEADVYLGVSCKEGRGVWAALIRTGDEEETITGQEEGVTANYLDIVSAAEALGLLPERIRVKAYSYSDYLRNGATQWLAAWKGRQWRTKDGDPVKNVEAWQWLDEELSARKVEWPSLRDDDLPPPEFEQIESALRAMELGGEQPFDWE